MTKSTPIALLSLRISICLVMFMWTLDKLLRPEHAITVYQHFYFLSNITTQIITVIAIAELILLACFLTGIAKRLSYGVVLLIHAISTLSTYKQYLNPYQDPNLLFFAAIPMLAACFTLYLLREEDTLCTLTKK